MVVMKGSIFQDTMPCSPLKSADVSEDDVASHRFLVSSLNIEVP
jgi:hypothetical protein